MLEELRGTLPSRQGASLEVTVFQNASPCAGCSQKYVQLVTEARRLHVDLRLRVAFVALYKVRRPSRAWNPTYNVFNLSSEVHRRNVRGLQSLRDEGVELSVFGFPDWQRLRQLLGLTPAWQEDTVSVLERESGTTDRDLQRLLVENVESDEEEEEEEGDNMQLAESSEEDEEPQPPIPNGEPAELDRKAEFLMFWNSGLHGVHWRRGARALYVIDGQEVSDLFTNTALDAEHHAETFLIRALKTRLLALASADVSVTVYQNLSPCGSCCLKYANLLEFFRDTDDNSSDDENSNRAKTIKLTIVFARFYNIKRPSCDECTLHSTPSEREHCQGMSGLLMLRGKGVALHCFQEQDWVALHQHLQVPGAPADYASSRRKLEDDLMARDTKEVFGFDLLARPEEDQAEGGADWALVYRRELGPPQATLLTALEKRLLQTEDIMRVQTATLTSEVKRLTSVTSTLALSLVVLLALLLCYFLFGWRPLLVVGILVTQLGMTWAGQAVLRRGERAFLLVHVVHICLSAFLVWMLYPLGDWRKS